MSGENKCEYTRHGKVCGHPLGEWQPSSLKSEGFGGLMIRTCEKCGGQQLEAEVTDAEMLEAIHMATENAENGGESE